MKIKNKFTKVISLVFSIVLFVSCSEENPIPSEITFFPTFEIEGGQYVIAETGTTYTDTGVRALAGESEIPFTTTGSVDTSQVGLYTLTYSATNADGFDATSFKWVIVVDDPAAIAANDISGVYFMSGADTRVNNVSKVADGFYFASDILPNNNIAVIIAQVSDTELIIPRQSSPFGDIAAHPADVAGSGGDLLSSGDFNLRTFIGCCGIFSRSFIKQ